MTSFLTALLSLLALSGSDPANDPPRGEPDDPSSGLLRVNLADEVTLKVFGRLFVDWGWFSGDADTYGTLADATEIRTARLGAEGTIYEQVFYKVEYDFATDDTEDGTVQAKDVYMALRESPAGEIRVGHFKEPFGLEQLTSSRFITFMERALPDAFVPGRNSGAAVLDHNGSSSMTWGAGAFRTTDDTGFDAGDAEYSFTGRVTGTPWYEEEGADLLHLGTAVTYRMDESVRFRARPESALLDRPVDTTALAADDTTVVGVESAWVRGPVSLQAEYDFASVSGAEGASDGDYSGFYAFVSWFVTGEHRAYKRSSGAFDRVRPFENFGAGPGAIELAARYSMIDLEDGATSGDATVGGELADVTFGVNWYLNPNARVMLNYVHSEFDDVEGTVDDDSADILMMRFQVDF